MSHDDYYQEHLAEHLDTQGDLAPPWEKFPHYERHTIGWRMGTGESWLMFFNVFLDKLPKDYETRLAFLRRHAKAPYTWSDWVHDTLYPDGSKDDITADDFDGDDIDQFEQRRKESRCTELVDLGLVGTDVAYFNWRNKQTSLQWPWEDSETPADAARYNTRELWYWSRWVDELRTQGGLPAFDAPAEWREIVEIIRTGKTVDIVPKEGLVSLARCLAAGNVIAPWQIGLSPNDFDDSFEMDMGYVDAFRLWGMSIFDDPPMIDRYAKSTQMPGNWRTWIDEQFLFY